MTEALTAQAAPKAPATPPVETPPPPAQAAPKAPAAPPAQTPPSPAQAAPKAPAAPPAQTPPPPAQAAPKAPTAPPAQTSPPPAQAAPKAPAAPPAQTSPPPAQAAPKAPAAPPAQTPLSGQMQMMRPQQKRRWLLLASFILFFLIPGTLVTLYYGLVVTDRYGSTAGFSIRGVESGAELDGLGALTGLVSSGSTTTDSYVVLKFLESRELIEALESSHALRRVYSDPSIDYLSRLPDDAPIEDFMDYWLSRIDTAYDPSSGIIEFTVQSFSPEHALELADTIVSLAQSFVNDLSAKARQDSLKFAREEVALQEQKLREVLDSIRVFRDTQQSVDPAAVAALDIQLLANLEARLVEIRAKISVLGETLNDDAPSLIALVREAEAIEQQIQERKTRINGDSVSPSGSNVTSQLREYESLEVDKRFIEASYASSLASLEQARRSADRQQRYLAVHMRPQAADISEYPEGLRNSALAIFVLFALWSIGVLIVYSVRDHLT